MVSGASPIDAGEVPTTLPFRSILFDGPESDRGDGSAEVPACFADLHLDDIVASVTASRGPNELATYFYEALPDLAAVTYRHDVFRDLEDPMILNAIQSFGRQMQGVRREIEHAAKTSHGFDQERWILRAAKDYCSGVAALNGELTRTKLRSTGLSGFRDFLACYAASDDFTTLVADTQRLEPMVSGVSYRLRIHGSKVTVMRARPEPDYSAEVLETFEKFRQGTSRKFGWRFDEGSDMNHVEAAIIDRVARLYPEMFAVLHEYADRRGSFLDPTIARFDREIQLYLAWLEYVDPMRAAGLPFCYPQLGPGPSPVSGRAVFDLALAASLLKDGLHVVPNDIDLRDGERILVVSGPNQGGKTTFARAVGQLFHLAMLGLPVPGKRLDLPAVDRIFTHFERPERVEDLSSKLEDDLRRVERILDRATPESLVIMNESFTSTTVHDQLFIGRRIMGRLVDLGPLAVVVTFLDELSSLDPAIVSVVGEVDPDDRARRTFKIVRRKADGLAYALAIAEKHRLTYPSLKARLN